MSIRDELLNKYLLILEAKEVVRDLPKKYVTCRTFNEKKTNDETITIVMTTHNRPEQTLFTLKTIANSGYDNVHVVLIDDYVHILLYDAELVGFGVHISYVRIKNKFWTNPCVSFNIGFRYVTSPRVIIQSAEVCHTGDVISYVDTHLKEGTYLSFDVLNFAGRAQNFLLHTRKSTSYKDTYTLRNYKGHWPWYQHHKTANNNLHFLTAITKKDLDKVGWFDLDYSIGSCWDDNAFIDKIKLVGLQVCSINNEQEKVMGIHQWHKQTPVGYAYKIGNKELYEKKTKYTEETGEYMDLTVDNIPKNIVARIKRLMDEN